MTFPQIDMRRVFLIARRDFVGYIKTWGFWISLLVPMLLGLLAFVMAQSDISVEPVRYETILDETGLHAQNILDREETKQNALERQLVATATKTVLTEEQANEVLNIYDKEGLEGVRAYVNEKAPAQIDLISSPPRRMFFVNPPAETIEGLQPYLRGEKVFEYGGTPVKLNGALHIFEEGGETRAQYWSSNINSLSVQTLAGGYFDEMAINDYLEQGGLSRSGLRQARSEKISVQAFDPTKAAKGDEGQAVTITDRIPFIVAAAATLFLWLSIFSGSYILLTSMLEEKLNKLLEMMLASARFSEIICGKLLGVAALTIAAMLPYILVAIGTIVGVLLFGDPAIAEGLSQALSPKLLVFFPIFLILGYVFYGAFFIALGSLSNSMQDAQTLTTPIMIVLTACILVIPVGISSPDSAVLTFASWFPLSAPFAAIMRLPSDPSWLSLIMSALFVLLMVIAVIALAGRIFQYGVLSGSGVKGIKAWLARVIFRRKAEG